MIPIIHMDEPSEWIPRYVPLVVSDICADSKLTANKHIQKWIDHLKPQRLICKVQPYYCYFKGYCMVDAFKPAGSRTQNSEFYAYYKPRVC